MQRQNAEPGAALLAKLHLRHTLWFGMNAAGFMCPMRDRTLARAVLPSDYDQVATSQLPSYSGALPIRRHTVEQYAQPPEGTERIVLAESDPSIRKATMLVLRVLGYHVQAYACGQELLVALEGDEQPIAMLLTDFDIPGLTGYELAGRLRRLRPNIKVLLTTGSSEASILPAAKPADWLHFIHKPFTILSLSDKLLEILEDKVTPLER